MEQIDLKYETDWNEDARVKQDALWIFNIQLKQ
jgi:hypothetical protein